MIWFGTIGYNNGDEDNSTVRVFRVTKVKSLKNNLICDYWCDNSNSIVFKVNSKKTDMDRTSEPSYL